MKRAKTINRIRNRRAKKIRSKIVGDAKRPRMSIFRSNSNMYVQLIDDNTGKTLAAGSLKAVDPKKVSEKAKDMTTGRKLAYTLGTMLGEKATEAKIKTVIFDRGRYRYHGKVKALVEGIRDAGIKV